MNEKRTKTSARLTLCLVAIFFGMVFSGPKLSAQSIDLSARAFVTQFYNWYVPQALQDRAEPTWHIALKRKGKNFAPLLTRLLRADWAAQDKCEDLVGLDFDPILNTQDPATHYEVGEVKHQGSIYTAEIYSEQAGQRNDKPDISASFRRSGGRWIFVNFYYPNGRNLVTMLKVPKLPCSAPRSIHKGSMGSGLAL